MPVKSSRKAQNGMLLSLKDLAKFMESVGNEVRDCNVLPRKERRSGHRLANRWHHSRSPRPQQ
jgi:hypothetical protein